MAPPLPGYSSHFGLDNIPFGIASSDLHPAPVCATRFKDSVIFLDKLDNLLDGIQDLRQHVMAYSMLNAFAALPNATHRAVRERLQSVIREDEELQSLPTGTVEPIGAVTMHLPVGTGDFTDMSCSTHHAQNASEAMTGKRLLPPAFLHMPIGYAGRCSSLDISGTPVERPLGQYWTGKPGESDVVFGPCKKMDYELELAAVIGKPLQRKQRLLASQAEEHIFGYVLLNDWSARDIQGFEMIPLGPLNGKNAGTTLSPWVVTTHALNAYRTASPPRTQKVMPYLADSGNAALDIKLEVRVSSPNTTTEREFTCHSNSSWMYWTLAQCVAHQAIGGCGLRTGDLIATGTVSGAESNEHGCLMEYMKQGKQPPRGYLEDGETVILSGYCGEGVGFGECVATLTPARDLES
ncbi:hypothetical protein B0A54_05469 [Friedmanniomyces endolithicus]|uniref:Fumarylacetoacetase n=1 Tax=Friedmanniomyces endolithicus TaxID=329885 RepID=A0A4U0V709_9PEZI|nr:hypothetical protein LTS09_010784 [Friedmanniomyces endolithicus]TKA43686.1 hypothetical protein B0A54_05469 [Friedmanniomyces endolithicus]